MKKMKKATAVITVLTAVSMSAVTVSGSVPDDLPYENGSFEETGKYGKYDEDDPYKLILQLSENNGSMDNGEFRNHKEGITDYTWWEYDDTPYCALTLKAHRDMYDSVIRIPNIIETPESMRCKSHITVRIAGSISAGEFDLDPDNKYMTCVDNVIFSKDGKTLMSYAARNHRLSYTIPDGTENIVERAFGSSYALREITMPDTVKSVDKNAFEYARYMKIVRLSAGLTEIPEDCFKGCSDLNTVIIPKDSKLKYIGARAFKDTYHLKELYLPDFDVEIERSAFKYNRYDDNIKLYSYVKTDSLAFEKGIRISWTPVSNASYYKVYQCVGDSKYELIETTADTVCNISKYLRHTNGSTRTFAVKAFAEIPAANYDSETDKGRYPEAFFIEGAMSDTITVTGK